MAIDSFQKLKDSTNRTFNKLSAKTSSTLEKSKINKEIDALNYDVQIMLANVGAELYNLWLKGETSSPDLIKRLEDVKVKKDSIEKLMGDIQSVDSWYEGVVVENSAPEQTFQQQYINQFQQQAAYNRAPYQQQPQYQQQVPYQQQPPQYQQYPQAPVQPVYQQAPVQAQQYAPAPAPAPESAPAQGVESAEDSQQICPSCGAQCDVGAKFCRKCGYKLV